MFDAKTGRLCAAAVCCAALLAGGGLADDGYDPPATYYDPARPGGVWLTGSALANGLHGIITQHVYRPYDTCKYAPAILDADPQRPGHILLVYDGRSVSAGWDSGGTWNREHLWPDSLNSNANDLFNIKPCTPSVNSARGNKNYGTGPGEWDADRGSNDRGDCARAMFYMATRYPNLTLVYGGHGGSGSNELGDLADLLRWHYEDPVSEFERRRNHLIYSFADNPVFYQGNRNPFIDHPELVWTLFGSGASDARLYVGDVEPDDGASNLEIYYGERIQGAAPPAMAAVTLHKSGVLPTTFAVLPGAGAQCGDAGPRESFAYHPQTRTIYVGPDGSVAVPGPQSATVVIDNTELTSSGVGRGSADADDVITLNYDVLAHAEGSFAADGDTDTLVVDFGVVPAQSGVHARHVTIHNLETAAGYTAPLDIVGVNGGGDVHAFATTITPQPGLSAGMSWTYTVQFDASHAAGRYSADFSIDVTDSEDLAGSLPGTPLTLTLQGGISLPACHGDMNCDGGVDFDDITLFVTAIGDDGGDWGAAYQALYGQPPLCPFSNGDGDGDGDVDFDDITPFVASIPSTCPY